MEGYFDALSLWNAGIKNVVATLGTALTREHLELIRRFTSNIVVIFDPDEGGRSALERSLVLIFLKKNLMPKSLSFLKIWIRMTTLRNMARRGWAG